MRPPALADTRLIVTRPAVQAHEWVQQLAAHGMPAVALPLIDIEPLGATPEVAQAWAGLAQQALVVFVSSNAAQCFFAAQPAGMAWPARTSAAAVGPGTAAALCALGVPAAQVVSPAAPPFDSEALWAMLKHQAWQGRGVLWVRGEGGRDWLAQQLAAHGAPVTSLCTYRRRVPQWGEGELAVLRGALAHAAQQVWWFSSSQAIDHLQALVKKHQVQADWPASHALASHARIAQRARELGFGHVDEVPPLLHELLGWWSRSIQSPR